MKKEDELLAERMEQDAREKEEKRLAEQREAIMEMSGCPSEQDEPQGAGE